MVSVPYASVSLETYILVDRHTFSDKYISYFLCFHRLRFKKCSCIPSSFVFFQVLMKKARLLQYHMQDKSNKTLTWDVPHQLPYLSKFIGYDYDRSKQWYWETNCVHSTATKYWCCFHKYYFIILVFLTYVSVAILIQQTLPNKHDVSNVFNVLW